MTPLTRLKAGDPVSAAILNKPLSELSARTDYLNTIMEDLTSSEFNYKKHVPIELAAEAGNLVYLDFTTGIYKKARALWSEDLTTYGSLKPAPCALFAGIVAEKVTNTSGNIITSGDISDFQNKTSLFGTSDPEPGIYYLSPVTEGVVTIDPPAMMTVAVIYDVFGNLRLMTGSYDHSTHDHKTYEIPNNWVVIADSQFDDLDVPSGMTHALAISETEDLSELFTYPTGLAVFALADGSLSSDFEITTDTIYSNFNVNQIINVYMAVPNSHGPNIVRSLTTDTPDFIEVDIVNGIANISMKEIELDSVVNNDYTVVKNITNNVKELGSVVSQILTEGDLSVISSSDGEGRGVVTLALSGEASQVIDASVINLNNAIETTVNALMYTVFPAGRTSSMTLSINMPKWSGNARHAEIGMWVRGNGSTLPAFNLDIYALPLGISTGQAIPIAPTLSTTIDAGTITTTSDQYYRIFKDLSTDLVITSGMQLHYVISPADTSNDLFVLRHATTLKMV